MKLASLLLIASLCLGAESAKRFVVISDIHFNPLADPAVAGQLMAAEPSQWESIFVRDSSSLVQKYGDDACWPLLSALLSEVRDLQPKPRLILVTGDVLTHRFQDKLATALHTTDPAAFRSFAKKTFDFLSLELEKASGGTPVVYTIGNNDEECGDYSLQPDGPFLRDTAEDVKALAHLKSKQLAAWASLGSYETANPLGRSHRIIALNTNFWSRRYTNTCGLATADPGAAVLKWVASELAEAERKHDKVWLVYHIPPGIDGHTSSRSNQVVSMWKQPYADGFDKLLDQYRNTIELNLAGHTHLDDIRLVKTEHTTTLVLINPAVSPNVGQNPAFRVVTVDKHERAEDVVTYYMPDLKALKWQMEYSVRSAYGMERIDAASYEALYSQIDKSPSVSDKWKLYYGVSRPAGLNDSKSYIRSLYCASGNSAAESYQACVADVANKQ